MFRCSKRACHSEVCPFCVRWTENKAKRKIWYHFGYDQPLISGSCRILPLPLPLLLILLLILHHLSCLYRLRGTECSNQNQRSASKLGPYVRSIRLHPRDYHFWEVTFRGIEFSGSGRVETASFTILLARHRIDWANPRSGNSSNSTTRIIIQIRTIHFLTLAEMPPVY